MKLVDDVSRSQLSASISMLPQSRRQHPFSHTGITVMRGDPVSFAHFRSLGSDLSIVPLQIFGNSRSNEIT